MHPQTHTGLPFKFTPGLPGFQLTSSKGSIFLVMEPGVFGRTPNACDHGESLGSTVQKRCVMVYVTSCLRTRERETSSLAFQNSQQAGPEQGKLAAP